MANTQQRVTPAAHDLRTAYNETGATIPQGTILTLVDGSDNPGEITIADSATRAFYGIAYEDIPHLRRDTSQIRGVGLIKLGADLNAGDRVIANDDGHAVLSPVNTMSLGQIIDGGSAGELVECELNAATGTNEMFSSDLVWRIVPQNYTRVIPTDFDLVVTDVDIQPGGVLDIETDGRLILV